MAPDLAHLLHSYLGLEKINLDKEEFIFQTLSHPTYPSLHALTGVLDHFNIENIAVELPTTKEALSELPNRFMMHFEKGREPGMYLTESLGNQLYSVSGEETNEQISETQLLEDWSGVILVIENDGSIQETKEKSGFSFYRNLIALTVLTLVILSFVQTGSILLTLFLALSIAGVGFSYLILSHENGNSNKLFDKICSSSKTGNDCGEILNSEVATISSDLKLGDLSLIYFMGLSGFSILCFLTGLAPGILPIIAVGTIPVIIYSLYQQLFVLKKICRVCMFIVGVLTLQVGLAAYILFTSPIAIQQPMNTAIIALTSLFGALLIWKVLKTNLQGAKNQRELTINNLKFKRDATVLYSLLETGKYRKQIEIPNEIVLGCKEDPVVELLIVTNPFCSFCRDVHDVVHSIYNRSLEGLKIVIRFNAAPEHVDTDSYKICHRLLEIYHTQPEAAFIQAIDGVYHADNPSDWLKANGIGQIETYDQVLADYYNWCVDQDANFTPIMIINGKEFPKQYEREDLDFLIDAIVEEEQDRREIASLTSCPVNQGQEQEVTQ